MLRRAAVVAAARVSATGVRMHQRLPRRGLSDLNPPPKPPPSAVGTRASSSIHPGKLAAIVPGLGLAFGVAQGGFGLAEEISTRTGVSVSGVPVAILTGALINNLPSKALVNSALCRPGVGLASSTVLRVGIVCVGAKLSIMDVAAVGAYSVPIVLTSLSTGLLVVPRIAKYAGLSPKLGALLAVGTSVCGVTAVSALAPAIGATAVETSIAVANVAAFGTIGMLVLPQIAHQLLGTCSEAAGAFLGAGIHDTAQVFGAALTYREKYGDDIAFDTAAVTKLTRNLSLALAIPFLATGVNTVGSSNRGTNSVGASKPALIRKAIPPFLLAFLLASVVRSTGDAYVAELNNEETKNNWKKLVNFVGTEFGAKQCLGTAMAAVGLNLSFAGFRGVGVTPFVVGGAGAVGVSGGGRAGAFGLATVLQATRGDESETREKDA